MSEPTVGSKAPKVAYKRPKVKEVESLTGVLKKGRSGPPKKMPPRDEPDR